MASTPERTPEEELHDVDWPAVERTDEFRELVAARKRFVVPATIFFLVWYLAFIALAGYAPDFMAESVYEGLTVGYVLALTQFLMVAVLGLMYLRRAQTVFDPLADKVADMVADRGDRFLKEGHPSRVQGTPTEPTERTRTEPDDPAGPTTTTEPRP